MSLSLFLRSMMSSIAPQEVVDRFHSETDRAGRLVLVQILEREVRRARLLDNAFDDSIDWRIVPALEARYFESDQIGMTRGKLRRPHLVIGAGGVAVLPYVADIERMRNNAGTHFVA